MENLFFWTSGLRPKNTVFTRCLVVDTGETDGFSVRVLDLFLALFDLQHILKSLITFTSEINPMRNRGAGKISLSVLYR